MQRLAIITTHPIQYYAPIFELLHRRQRIAVQVFYTWGESSLKRYDPGFEKTIEWDLPLLSGYHYSWVVNVAAKQGSHNFSGVDTPYLHQQVMDWGPHAVLIFGWAYKGHLSALRYFKKKVPVFFRGDSTLLDEVGGMRSVLKKVALKWIYSHVDRVFYTGTQNRLYFKAYGVADDQLIFAPHAVDNDRFSTPRLEEVKKLRQRLKIHEDNLLILFTGKFEQKKNPLILLESFKNLTRADVNLLFVGSGELSEVLKIAAAPDSRVHFIDFQNQSMMPVAYQAADLFCLPSSGTGESWGLAVNEAMAAGKPVLVSDKVGCAVDLVTDGRNGEKFKSGSAKALKSALERLTANRASLKQLGAGSQEIITAWNFTAIALAIENATLNIKQ